MCEPATITAISTWFSSAAGAATAGMSGLQTAALVTAAAGTGLTAYGQYQSAQTAKKVASNNAQVAEYQAQDAIKRGEEDAHAVRRKAAALKGSQRATMAARGLDLSQGTPADILDQTDFFAQADAATARNNGRREAWSRQAQGSNFRAEAEGYSPLAAASGTLLGGASNVADKWYSYRRGR